jgi:hypothetical protein
MSFQPSSSSHSLSPSAFAASPDLVGSSGQVRRWPGARIPSIAAVSALFNDFARTDHTSQAIRVGGPITSLVLSSVLDTSKRDLQAVGVIVWIETDRRDDRRDGWTIDRVSLAGRWLVLNDNMRTYVCGSTAGGPPDPSHEVWKSALNGRTPEELDVQVWQRTDRTAWVLHDGDGQVLAEFVIDEQRRMGTHESTVDVRLLSSKDVHPLFDDLSSVLDEFLSRRAATPPSASNATSQQRRRSGVEKLVAPAGFVPSRRATDLTAPLWVIRAAVDVETMTRRHVDNQTMVGNGFRELSSLAALIGSLPELRARHHPAAQQLESFCDELVEAERALVRCTDDGWAMRKLTKELFVGDTCDQWLSLLSDSAVALGLLRPHAPAIRGLVLTMLERTDSELVGTANSEFLSGAVAAWVNHGRSSHRASDSRRAGNLRAAISAYRFSVESSSVASDTTASIMSQARQLDSNLTWLRRRSALIDLVSQATDSVKLPAADWMRLGITMNDVERRIEQRLVTTRKQAQRTREALG